ncbi:MULTISPECIES: DUF6612 family protein [unclassified Granulicatella]|uniref:DUF6612 family protein n=1 Tax=unclassified Granulicatella TaxID=2630493 RepID=UPI001073016E|nr:MULTISPECIES: DUF6612 family protein [unclassified Granulicatella]MBF0779678.1 hypothetical protein [Granulicatella sp. 19428wC4_WM01]TFU96332.1 hypothetical protein E4T68_01095 [Granulicatella sp. WM01]
MKKRLLFLGACILLGACQNPSTPQQSSDSTQVTTQQKLSKTDVLNKQIEAAKTIKSLAMDIDVKVKVDETKMEQVILKNSVELIMDPLTMKMNMQAFGVESEFYYVNDKYYVKVNGEWIESNGDVNNQINSTKNQFNALENLNQEYATVDEKDAYYLVNVDLVDKEKIEDYLKSSLYGSGNDSLINSMMQSGGTIDKITASYKVDKKTFYLMESEGSIIMTVPNGGNKQTVAIDFTAHYKDVNAVKSIELPNDLPNR